MHALELIAERRLEEALEAGLFDDLPGAGRPLELEDLSRVPAELRSCVLVLRGANVLPEELELHREVLRLGDLLRACTDPAETRSLEMRRSLLLLRHEILKERRQTRG